MKRTTTRIRLSKKKRIELEKIFFSCVLATDILTDYRHITEEYSVSWRHFADRRHQALWRALESLYLGTEISRRSKILDEKFIELAMANSVTVRDQESYIRELVYAWEGQYESELQKMSSARAWLERELEKIGAFIITGGRAYLEELYAQYPVPAAAKWIAGVLGYIREEKPINACWNCAQAHGRPTALRCELYENKLVAADEGHECEYWEEVKDLLGKIEKDIKGEE